MDKGSGGEGRGDAACAAMPENGAVCRRRLPITQGRENGAVGGKGARLEPQMSQGGSAQEGEALEERLPGKLSTSTSSGWSHDMWRFFLNSSLLSNMKELRICVSNALGSGGDIVVVPGIMCEFQCTQCTFGSDSRSQKRNVERQRVRLMAESVLDLEDRPGATTVALSYSRGRLLGN